MSLLFKKSRPIPKPIVTKTAQPIPIPSPHGSVKYVELFGSLASGELGAGLSKNIIDYKVPDGHCAELFAIGVQPDIDSTYTVSNLKEIEICYDGKGTGIKFLTNHMGKNALPYGDAESVQPIRLLDYPMRAGNLTVKYNEGMRIQLKATAKGVMQSNVYARAKIYLYEPADVSLIFGASISNFATLPGGVSQALPKMIFADYIEDYATQVRSKWEVAYQKEIKDYEEIQITHIGVVPHDKADALKLYSVKTKWEAPEYEPYFKITKEVNALPFGDDADYQPMQRLPSPIADKIFSNDTLQVQVKDDGSAQATVSIQLLGVYRRVR
ncbi:MAG: hypothetical protein NC827_05960 [Candidatus Omnitrophica bacterium]|nr:hypothetical protein [Candidatus Omnitrophota bacterium]